MPTDRQSAASRANAQNSTGPRTEFGKVASRFNALKHGIDVQQQIMFTESADDLAELAAENHELHSPADADERFPVDTLVSNEWRLRRMRSVEADLWLTAAGFFLDKDIHAPEARLGDAFQTAGPAFDRLPQVVNSCERNYHRALKELQALIAARQARPVAASEPAHAPQPEESTATSESPASFHTYPETAPAEAPLRSGPLNTSSRISKW